MGGRRKKMRRDAQRLELSPKDWSDKTPDSVDDDSVGKPCAERKKRVALYVTNQLILMAVGLLATLLERREQCVQERRCSMIGGARTLYPIRN